MKQKGGDMSKCLSAEIRPKRGSKYLSGQISMDKY